MGSSYASLSLAVHNLNGNTNSLQAGFRSLSRNSFEQTIWEGPILEEATSSKLRCTEYSHLHTSCIYFGFATSRFLIRSRRSCSNYESLSLIMRKLYRYTDSFNDAFPCGCQVTVFKDFIWRDHLGRTNSWRSDMFEISLHEIFSFSNWKHRRPKHSAISKSCDKKLLERSKYFSDAMNSSPVNTLMRLPATESHSKQIILRKEDGRFSIRFSERFRFYDSNESKRETMVKKRNTSN